MSPCAGAHTPSPACVHTPPVQAKRCAKREPGRSWEALESELTALGVHPSSWPLPLTAEAVREAQKNPEPQVGSAGWAVGRMWGVCGCGGGIVWGMEDQGEP